MAKQNYPDGVERMDDYIGAFVKLQRPIRTRHGEEYDAGQIFVVGSHYRGRLNLHHRKPGSIDPGKLAIRGVDRIDVELRWLRVA